MSNEQSDEKKPYVLLPGESRSFDINTNDEEFLWALVAHFQQKANIDPDSVGEAEFSATYRRSDRVLMIRVTLFG